MRTMLLPLVLMMAMGWPTAGRAAPQGLFKAWVPAGWKLIQQVQGDLDGDGREDAVLVLERTNPANIHRNHGLGTSQLNLNPRRLLVLFQGPAGWRKGLQTDRFLPSENDAEAPCLADPLGEEAMAIRQGVLTIDLSNWSSCGSWGSAHYIFRFRLEEDRFRLIGLDITSRLRNTGEEGEFSINYLTGRTKNTETPPDAGEEGGPKPRTTWGRLPGPRAYYLDRMSSRCTAGNATTEWCR